MGLQEWEAIEDTLRTKQEQRKKEDVEVAARVAKEKRVVKAFVVQTMDSSPHTLLIKCILQYSLPIKEWYP